MTFSEPTESAKHTLRTVATTLTDTGRTRDHNEDYTKIYIPSDPQVLTTKGTLYLVADGLGGHQAGEVASQRASETLIAEYYADEQSDIAASLTQALHNANTDVYTLAQAKQQRRGMGTTMVAAVVRGREIYLANVGDSRAYLFRKGDLRQCTKDHSLVQAQIDAGMLSSEEARHHPQRNVITRSIGHAPQVEVDIFEGQLRPGDILLLCSDGLSGPVSDTEITTLLKTYPKPQEAVVQLVNRANERGGPDNISVLLVQVLPYASDQPVATEVEPERSMLVEATQLTTVEPEPLAGDISNGEVLAAGEIPTTEPSQPGPLRSPSFTTLAILAILIIASITVLVLWLIHGSDAPLWPFINMGRHRADIVSVLVFSGV